MLEIVTYIMAGLIGLCVGSFLNVVIYRLPNKMSLATPASHCPRCNYMLKWYDNIPILSYIILGGKCRSCRQRISFRYTAVEISNMLLWIACVWRFFGEGGVFDWIYMCVAMIISSVLIVIFFIDLEHMIIPDRFQITLAVCGVILTVCDALNENATMSVTEHLLGALLGGGLFFIVFMCALYFLNKEGLGGGDVKLMAVLGLILGWKFTLVGLIISSVSGSIILLLLNKRNDEGRGKEYPFAPFLTVGALVSYLFCGPFIEWYATLIK